MAAMNEKRKSLRWKKGDRVSSFNFDRPWHLSYGGVRLATAHKTAEGMWMWSCPEGRGLEWRNSAAEGRKIETPAEAKAECMAYVRANLQR